MASANVRIPRCKRPEYPCWKSMISRCSNPKNASWKYYGAKGIAVCERWRRSFEDFAADMGPRPTAEHQLDRIDNSKGYEPGNVRWATPAEQAWNTSKCRYMTLNGETKCIMEWVKKTGIKHSTITSRVKKFKWSHEKALTTPPNKGNRQRRHTGPVKGTKWQVTYLGKTYSINHWATITGINVHTLYYRMEQGWPLAKVFAEYVQIPPESPTPLYPRE